MSSEKKILILGAGESGVGAALLAESKGYKVLVSDHAEINPVNKKELIAAGIEFEENGHDLAKVENENIDEIIKSPGIPDSAPIIKHLLTTNSKIISEIEFASQFTSAKMVVITGTNGKTTTTLLSYHLLKTAGLNVALAGNVGTSLARQVLKNNHDYYVMEASSFQLEGMFEFKADIGILLNITPDHLDRYSNNFSDYIDAKFRLTNNMGEDDHFIFNDDDPVLKPH